MRHVFFLLTAFGIILFFYNRGLTFFDEGYILHSADRILNGNIPYRDFSFIYTPGSIYLVVLFFKLFGVSIISGRILTAIISFATITLIYFLSIRIIKNPYLRQIPVLVFISWLPAHINFPWPVVFVAFAYFLTAAILYFGMKTGKDKYFFLAGLTGILSFLFKQNFGLAIIAGSAISLYFLKSSLKSGPVICYSIGLFTGSLIFMTYLFLTGSFYPFFSDFYVMTIQSILLEGQLNTPFVYGKHLYDILKIGFYLLPLIIPLISFFLLLKKSEKNINLTMSIFSGMFYLSGIRPTTDFIHLVPLFAVCGFPLVIIVEKCRSKAFKKGFITLSILLIITGFYTAIFGGYYRWLTPIADSIYFTKYTKINLYLDRKQKQIVPEISDYIKSHTNKNDYILVIDYIPIFYFITDRKNPTVYDGMIPKGLQQSTQEDIISGLKNKKVNLVLSYTPPDNWGNDLIRNYVMNNFKITENIYEYSLWLPK